MSSNYIAVAQMANLMAEWLILAGAEIQTVQQLVENHLHDMILKTFDPKKADAIFAEEGETPSWLAELIEYPTWRSLIYRLAEEYPDCLMLNFTIKLISDAGFQGEITSISTAAQQIEVFSRILKTSVTTYLTSTPETMTKNLSECSSMVCHGQHTYVYAQVTWTSNNDENLNRCGVAFPITTRLSGSSLHSCFRSQGWPCDQVHRIVVKVFVRLLPWYCGRRLQQEVQSQAMTSGHDVTPITMALMAGFQHSRAAQCLSSMLSRFFVVENFNKISNILFRDALNPADIVQLHKLYNASDPPPVELIRFRLIVFLQ